MLLHLSADASEILVNLSPFIDTHLLPRHFDAFV